MWLWWSAIPAGLLAAIALWLALVAAPRERERFIAAARAQREAMADDRAAAIDRWLLGGVGNARLLASYPTVAHLASGASVAGVAPGIGTRGHLETLLDGFRATKSYGAAAALAADLSVVGAAPPGYVPGSAALDLARRCVAGAVAVAEVLPGADGEPVVVFAAPILAGGGADRVVGAALLTEDPRQWLYPYVGHHPLVSRTGETVLLQRAGSDALFIAPLRHSAARPLALRVPLSTPGFGGAVALLGNERFGRYVDYRGVAFLGAPRTLKNAPWGLVVKIDEAEVLAPFGRWLRDAMALLLAFALAFGSLVYGLRRREGDRRALALARSEASLARLLDQANDAVLSVSRDGVIVAANRRAESMYGYTLAELRGLPVTALRLPEDRDGVPATLAAVAAAGRYALATEHLRRDGSSFPVEVSVSHLGDEGDGGFLAIARDVSERRRAEARIERLNRMLRTISEVNQLIVRERDPETLLAQACRTVVEMGGLALVWIGRLDPVSGEVRPVASAGAAAEALADVRVRADDSELGRMPTGVACRERRTVVVNDWGSDASVAPPPPLARQANLHAVAAFPLEGGTLGQCSFTAYSREPGLFDEEMIALLDELVADLAFALESIGARRALEQQDRLLRDMSRMARIGGWEFDTATGTGTWTDEVARIHGVDPGAATSATIGLSYYSGESRARIEAAIAGAVGEGLPYDLELELTAADGVRKWVRTVGVPITRDGRVVRLGGTFQDITERKLTEEALRSSEASLHLALDAASAGTWEWDLDTNRNLWSPETWRLYGLDEAGEPSYELWRQSVHPDDRAAAETAVAAAAAAGTELNAEWRVAGQDGTQRWVSSRGRPERDTDGRVVRYRGIVIDVTERRRAQENLEESEARFRQLFMAHPQPMWVYDLETLGFVEVNDAAVARYGFTRDEFLAMTLADIRPADDVTRLKENVESTSGIDGSQHSGGWRHRTRDGRVIDVEIDSHAVVHAGRPARVVTATDVTERKRAEEALVESERRYRELIQSANSAILRWRPDGTITFFNEYAESFFGYRADEVVGHDVGILVPATDSSGSDLSTLAQSIARDPERYVNVMNENVCRDGRRVWMTWTNRAIRDDHGNVTELLAIGSDLTEQKRVEVALQESRARLQAALASMTDAVFISDSEGRFVEFNDAFATFHRFATKAECATTFAEYPAIVEVFLPDGAPAPLEQWAVPRALRGETATNQEYTLRRKDTGATWVGNYAFAPIRDAGGRIVGSVVAGRDVTEIKRAEEALRATEARYRNTLDAMLEGCQIIGEDWRYLYINDTAERHNRRPRAELVGRRYMDCWPGIEATAVFAVIKRCLDERTWSAMENEFTFPDGAVGWFELRIYPVPEGIVILSVDITDRKHAELALKRLNEELEARVEQRTAELAAANKELEAFTYSVSHDLRAPLRAIDGFSRLLEEDHAPQLDAEAQRLLGVVRDNSQRMGRLIDDLLAFSRVGRVEVHRSAVDMRALAEAVLAELVPGGEGARIDVVVGELPGAIGDPSLLRQVWANLLANAVKFTARSERPRVEVRGRREDGEAVYEVADNGAGFDPRYADKLFGVFQRLHSGKEFPGTGVGLALVQRIVHRHGGRVWASGALQQGATFGFSLPVAMGEERWTQDPATF